MYRNFILAKEQILTLTPTNRNHFFANLTIPNITKFCRLDNLIIGLVVKKWRLSKMAACLPMSAVII